MEGCYSNQKGLGERGRQATSHLLAQALKGSCSEGGLPLGGREQETWKRSKPSAEKEGEARQG